MLLELPDTSIADTSTEDLNTSQTDESDRSKEDNQKDAVPAVGNKKEVQKTPEKLKVDKFTICQYNFSSLIFLSEG